MFRRVVVTGSALAVLGAAGVLTPPVANATGVAVPATAPAAFGGVRTATAPCTAARLASVMPFEQKVGQLFMVGNPATGASATVKSYIAKYHVGNVFLSGRANGGKAQVAPVTASLRAAVNSSSTGNVRLFISTDQEGGNVQVLNGPGFSDMATALNQGTYKNPSGSGVNWGNQLKAAGVNMNLAPVADTVPASLGRGNPPIGYWYREYSHVPSGVSFTAGGIITGMRSVGVATTAKHFPGLGLVRANTDTTVNVHDKWMTTSGNYSSYLQPFRTATANGVPFVMMSSAYYDNVDASRPAVFSPTVVSVLRNTIGFKGVIMTDDLGAAKAMSPWSYGTRAINTINAGGQLILTVTPAALPGMYASVLGYAGTNATFRARVDAAALGVLTAKQNYDLLPATC